MGARLGRYVVLRHLASGGMADVLLGRSEGIEGFERHVVLKRIRPEHARDQRFIRMFLDEARVAASLHHQHIVQVHDVGQADGEYFIAMEYLHGEDVRTILAAAYRARSHVPLSYAIAIVSAAAAGLHYAHERRGPDKRPLGIVHRDVSPSNILVGYDGSIKVVDFGIAKASTRQDTRSGLLKGKVSYMSPEQCKGATLDRRSDVYALGVVLYELATTSRLFKGDNDYLVMKQIVQGDVAPARTRRPDLPEEFSAILQRAIAPDPERRFATADELRVALERFAGKHGLTASTTVIAGCLRDQFGDKPEPWLELATGSGGEVAGARGGSDAGLARGSAGAPHGSAELSEIVAADRLAGAGDLPIRRGPDARSGGLAATDLARQGHAIEPAAGGPSAPGDRGTHVRAAGSRRGSVHAPGQELERSRPSAAGEIRASSGSTAVGDAQPHMAPATDSRMGWESQRPHPGAAWLAPRKMAIAAVPGIAILGIATWWLTAGTRSEAVVAAGTQPPAAAGSGAPVSAPASAASGAAPVSAGPPALADDASGHSANAHGGQSAGTTKISLSPSGARAARTPESRPGDGMASEAASVGSQRLSDTVVDRVASEHMRELVSCLGGESAHGARVRFRVRADGSVVRARVAMPDNPPRVRGCIEREVETWHFPPQPASDVPGAYTLSFR